MASRPYNRYRISRHVRLVRAPRARIVQDERPRRYNLRDGLETPAPDAESNFMEATKWLSASRKKSKITKLA